MKKFCILFMLLTLISCGEIQYDGEKRLVFQTIVKNSNGELLPNSNVEITTSTNYTSDLISKGRTNQNGEITLIFPAPNNDDININLNIYNYDTSYLQKELFNIRREDFENYKFILQNAILLKLDETASLQLTYIQTNFNTIVEKVSINGIYSMHHEVYNSSLEDYYPPPEEILIKKNQTFQLKYTILNTQTSIETDYIIDLTIGVEPLNYTIIF